MQSRRLSKFTHFVAQLSNGRLVPLVVCTEHDDAATKDAALRAARAVAADEPGPVETVPLHVRRT